MEVNKTKSLLTVPEPVLRKMGRGLLALKNTFALMAKISAFKKEIFLCETSLEKAITDLGAKAFDVNEFPSLALEIGIQPAKDAHQKALLELAKKKEKFDQFQGSAKSKESELLKKLDDIELFRQEKNGIYEKSYAEFKELDDQLKKQRAKLLSIEKRKQRVLEFKTQIPVSILTQAQSFSAEKVRTMERDLEKKSPLVEILRNELKKAEDQWMKGKKELDNCAKDTKIQRTALEDSMNQADQAKIAAEQELKLLFFDFGKRIEKNGDFPGNILEFKEKIGQVRKNLAEIKAQIQECESHLEELSRDRKWGVLLLMIVLSVFVLACIFILPRI